MAEADQLVPEGFEPEPAVPEGFEPLTSSERAAFSANLRKELATVRGQDHLARAFADYQFSLTPTREQAAQFAAPIGVRELPVMPPSAMEPLLRFTTSPEMAGQMAAPIGVRRLPPLAPTPALEVGAGATKAVLGGLESATAPVTLPLLPLATTPIGAETLALKFGTEAVGAGAGRLSAARTPGEVGAGLGEMALGVSMVGGTAVRLPESLRATAEAIREARVEPPPDVHIPTAQELEAARGQPQPSTTEIPSAIHQEAEGSVRPVQQPSGTPEGPREVPPDLGSQEAGARSGTAPNAPEGALPLSAEEQAAARAQAEPPAEPPVTAEERPAPPAEEAKPAPAKEPWQETIYEYETRRLASQATKDAQGQSVFDISAWTRPAVDEVLQLRDAFVYSPEGTSKTLVAFRPHVSTEMAASLLVEALERGDGPNPRWWSDHFEHVEKAAKEGKPVPSEVLADYPDIQAKPAPEAPAAESPAEGTPPPEGPGATTPGAPPYSAAQQLTDRLNAAPKVGTTAKLSWRERAADAWSKGRSGFARAFGRAATVAPTLRDIARGVRSVRDIDRRVAEFDYAIQSSSGKSRAMRRAIERTMRDKTDREAAAVLIDSGRLAAAPSNPAEVRQVIADSLATMPADTRPSVRRAFERALDPSLELRQFVEDLKQFNSLREQDAIASDLFEDGLRDYYTHVWEREANMPDSLRGAFASDKVSTYFQFARQRKLSTFMEGILEGKTPKLDPAEVLPFYNYSMDRAIASRELIRRLTDLKASDGRPAVEVSGVGKRVDTPDPAVVIKPKTQAQEINDYRAVDHPALRKWKWATATEDGTPVFLQGDLVVHPEFYERVARMMHRDRLTPTKVMAGALKIGSEIKGLKLGALPSTFHQIHVGAHAAFHWTDPFMLRKRPWLTSDKGIDWDNPFVKGAIEQGHLKLASSPHDLSLFAEGIGASKWTRHIPGIGKWSETYTRWLFEDYIPKLKLATYENALARAQAMQAHGMFKGLGPDELAARTGDAVNNAYGELNHLFLGKHGRDPRFQRVLRFAFLAPDFGEARLRFTEKAFTRYGHEERLAFATMALTLYFGARVANYLSHGDPEIEASPRNWFRVKAGQHWWSMRSVAGDIAHAFDRPQQFLYVRLNPATVQRAWDALSGRDVNTGRKLGIADMAERVAEAPLPLPLSSITRDDQQAWESLAGSMGLTAVRDTPEQDMKRLAAQWLTAHGRPQEAEYVPTDEPNYQRLRTMLRVGNVAKAATLLEGLRASRSDKQIENAMALYIEHPFTGSLEHEKQFQQEMTPPQRKLYLAARKEQLDTLRGFYKLVAAHPRKTP